MRSTIYKPFPQPLNSIHLPKILAEQFSEVDPEPGFLRIWPDEGEDQVVVDSAFGEVPKGCVISYQNPHHVKVDTTLIPTLNLPKLDYLPIVLGEKEHLFYSAIGITNSQSLMFEQETRMQSSPKKWHELRKFRLTASNFKNICSRKKDFESLSMRL